jgi:uncharacterized protein YegJ (DUF2314 family)
MHWKTRSRLAAMVLVSAGALTANADIGSGARAGDRTLEVAQGDTTMNAAQAEAQRHLDAFLLHATEDGLSVTGAALKVAFPDADGGNEVIWVEPFEVLQGGFAGRLANEPNALPGLARGDEVRFAEGEIRDWALWGGDGLLYGNFTTRVLLPRMRPESAARVAAVLSEAPMPPGW